MEELIGDNDHLKSYWELRQTELKEEGRRQAQGELQPKVDRVNSTFKAYHETAARAAQGVQGITDMLREAINSGAVDQQVLQRAFNSSPDAWRAMNDLTGSAGFYNGMRAVAATFGGDIGGEPGATFTGDYTTRWFNAEGGDGDPAELLKDQIKAYMEVMVEKAKAPLQKHIKSLEVMVEKAKAAGSGGPSPTAGVGTAGGKGSTAYADILKMTPSQIDALPDGALQEAIDKAQ
jgi:hypothetical protein